MPSISSDRSRLRRSYLLQIQKQAISKSYILLLLCSVSRIIHLELAPNLPILEVYREYEKANNRAVGSGGGGGEGSKIQEDIPGWN